MTKEEKIRFRGEMEAHELAVARDGLRVHGAVRLPDVPDVVPAAMPVLEVVEGAPGLRRSLPAELPAGEPQTDFVEWFAELDEWYGLRSVVMVEEEWIVEKPPESQDSCRLASRDHPEVVALVKNGGTGEHC